MSRFLSERYKKLVPYTPGEQRGGDVVKLNTNESPYPPSPAVLRAIADANTGRRLNKYPDPEALSLRTAIANHLSANARCEVPLNAGNILASNGSDEILAFAVMAYAGGGANLVFPDISYGFYSVFADIFGANAVAKPLDSNFGISASSYFDAGGTVVIANPNAPTGILLPLEEIERILQANADNIVIIDEAYIDFSKNGSSAVGLIGRYENLLVIRTFSKSASLAGIRVGYAVGSEELIADLNLIKYSFNPYNVDSVALAAAEAALADWAYYEKCIAMTKEIRSDFVEFLVALNFRVLPSQANFVFASPAGCSAKKLFDELNARNIMVRYFSKDRIDDFVRISIGTRDEMNVLQTAISEILEK